VPPAVATGRNELPAVVTGWTETGTGGLAGRAAAWTHAFFVAPRDGRDAMLVIHASMPLDPERRDEALEQIADLAETVREEEPGVLDYRATTDVNDPNVVRFFERYEDEQALAAHSQTDHYQAFAEALPGWLAGEPEVVRFDVDEMSELDL